MLEIDKVNRILRQMHPEYRIALQGKVIDSMQTLKQAAYEAQETRDDNPGESRPRDPGESDILGPGFPPGFIDGIPGLQE